MRRWNISLESSLITILSSSMVWMPSTAIRTLVESLKKAGINTGQIWRSLLIILKTKYLGGTRRNLRIFLHVRRGVKQDFWESKNSWPNDLPNHWKNWRGVWSASWIAFWYRRNYTRNIKLGSNGCVTRYVTHFFHASVVERRHRNYIAQLRNEYVQWSTDVGELENHARQFYQQLYMRDLVWWEGMEIPET